MKEKHICHQVTVLQKSSWLNELRKHVKEEIAELQGTLGYVEPGHGLNSKMRELYDDDVAEMYVLYKRKLDVLLWLHGNTEDASEVGDTTKSRK